MESIDFISVGHVLIDLRLRVDRIPGADEEASIKEETRGVGGSAANTAIAARRLGLTSGVIAKIGLDDFGRMAVDHLLREGVDVTGLRVSLTLKTGFSIVAIDKSGSITLYSFKGASEDLQSSEVPTEYIAGARHVHVASLRPDTSLTVMSLAKKSGASVSWDPGRRLALMGLDALNDIVSLADMVFVNRREAEALTGKKDPGEAARLIAERGPRMVVVKLGARGSLVLYEGETYFQHAIRPERVVDTTGAGDTYAATFVAFTLRGHSPQEAALAASLASSIKVSRLGSHESPTLRELLEKAGELGLRIPLRHEVG